MKELVAIVFKEKHRASKIFYRLRHETDKAIPDLRNAIVFIADENFGAIVEQAINLNNTESLGWSKFWSAFIGATMLTPFYYNSTKFVEEIDVTLRGENFETKPVPATDWWSDEIGLSTNVIRDLKALLEPDSSAILMVIDEQHDSFIDTKDFSGSNLLRIYFDDQQINKIRNYFW